MTTPKFTVDPEPRDGNNFRHLRMPNGHSVDEVFLCDADADALTEALAWGQDWPTRHDCAAHVRNSDPCYVKWFDRQDGEWRTSQRTACEWLRCIDHDGPLYGVRLVPIPVKPLTEWVRLDQIIGRTLPGETKPVEGYGDSKGEGRYWFPHGRFEEPLTVVDGMVEVLSEADQ